mmetsp:Transcript_15776/g.18244  ORF Transcript_15776/g.18244 Transcript_15776/m.18244 type:complete len:159 (-) Transcript_15776:509-985(-)
MTKTKYGTKYMDSCSSKSSELNSSKENSGNETTYDSVKSMKAASTSKYSEASYSTFKKEEKKVIGDKRRFLNLSKVDRKAIPKIKSSLLCKNVKRTNASLSRGSRHEFKKTPISRFNSIVESVLNVSSNQKISHHNRNKVSELKTFTEKHLSKKQPKD